MEEIRQITIEEWMQWKEDIREKLKETAENFVYIGYRLKQIRDSGMYGGAADIFEFAQNEYGLGKSTVSRFIAINEKFSVGGNSMELREPYRLIGSSKLSEMLTLTDEECALITEKTTVSQIRELKNFGREAPRGEEKSGYGEESIRTPLQKCIIEYFRGKRQMLDEVIERITEGDYKGASELISPNGNTTFKKGVIFLFMYDYQTGVKYKTFGENDITVMNWEKFACEIYEAFEVLRLGYGESGSFYDAFYGEEQKEEEKGPEKVEEMPERRNGKGSVATSQQGGETGGKHVEEMGDADEAKSGNKEDGGEAGEPADPAEPEDDEDGGGRKVEDPDVVYMGKTPLADIVMGGPKPTKEIEKAGENLIPIEPYDDEKMAGTGESNENIRSLIESVAYKSKRITKELEDRKRKTLEEYREVRILVNNLNRDLELLIRFIDLEEDEEEEE